MGDAAIARLEFEDDADGLQIALTPAQLAAVLAYDSVEAGGSLSTRLWGLVKLLGGTLETAGGVALLAVPEPTMVTKAGGSVLAVHGVDTLSTGAVQIWTGRDERTLTDKAASGLAHELGASPRTAANIGTAVDIAVPFAAVAAAGIARLISVRAGRISLVQHEATAGSNVGGHTIARHVAKTEAELRARIASTAGSHHPPPAISSFSSLNAAETAISRAMRLNKAALETWAKGGSATPHVIVFDAGKTVGQGVIRATGKLQDMSKLRIVLKKENYNGMAYYILTSFPIP